MKEHHISEPRINERIRVPEVRLVGPNGEQVGIVRVEDALRLAAEADLDLVEVAPMARPPVAKLMDFGKYKYEAALKAREARKNQVNTVIKEIKLRPKIDPHDYGTKKGHVERFLKGGDKVKVTIMFRGREQSRPELGFRLLQKLAEDISELGFVESAPKQDGRNMIMVIGPTKKKAEAKAEARRARESHSPSGQARSAGSAHAAGDASADEHFDLAENPSDDSLSLEAQVELAEMAEAAEAIEAAEAAEAAAAHAVVPDAAAATADDIAESVDDAVDEIAPEPAEAPAAPAPVKRAARAVPAPAPAAAATPAAAAPATPGSATPKPAVPRPSAPRPAAPRPTATKAAAPRSSTARPTPAPRPGPRPTSG